MKSAIAAAMLAGLAACSTPAASVDTAAPPPAPQYREQWYSLVGVTGDYAGLNLHQTALGWAGRLVTTRGDAMPLRSVISQNQTLSFFVPGLSATFAGHMTPDGWIGDWTVLGGEAPAQATLVAMPTAAPEEGKVVTISGGRQIHLICDGYGSPAVILDYGAGGTQKKDWAGLTGFIADAAKTQVCTYDRAGRGISDPGALPRDTVAVVKDLDEALAASGISPPYVLAGHSLGSYHVRQYANTHLDKVVGMVLVDPSGDGQIERFASVAPTITETQNKMMAAQLGSDCPAKLRATPVRRDDALAKSCQGNDADAIEATGSEIASMPGPSTAELRASHRTWGDLPLIVLTQGDMAKALPDSAPAEEREGMKQMWHTMHVEMAALSTRGVERTIPGSGHYIQRDAPQAVIDAITEVVAMARATKP